MTIFNSILGRQKSDVLVYFCISRLILCFCLYMCVCVCVCAYLCVCVGEGGGGRTIINYNNSCVCGVWCVVVWYGMVCVSVRGPPSPPPLSHTHTYEMFILYIIYMFNYFMASPPPSRKIVFEGVICIFVVQIRFLLDFSTLFKTFAIFLHVFPGDKY